MSSAGSPPAGRRGRARRQLAALGLGLAATALVAGCQGGSSVGNPAATPRSTRPAATPTATGGPAYYLSLGDSLAFGFQQQRFVRLIGANRYTPGAFPGYTALVARRLAGVRARVTAVNYGCPGETTVTFASGGCPFRLAGARLHDDYPGSQLAAAERFLRAHRGRTALVTLSLGANDLGPLESTCGHDARCLASGLPRVATQSAQRIGHDVRRLRAADPGVVIVVLSVYDPLAALVPATTPLLASFDDRLAAAARGAGARVADALHAFNLTGPQPARLCRLTLYCAAARDVHPSDAGYAVLARVLWAAAGLTSAR